MISNIDQRVLFYDDSAGTFTDYTRELNDYNVGSATFNFDTDDYLYFGSYLPFNHKYFEITTPNVITVPQPTVEYFNGSEWKSVVEILDYTEASDATFGQSGVLQFTPDKFNEIWQWVSRTTENTNLTEFSSGPEIYDKYWARLGFTTAINFELSYSGSLFCTEEELVQQYPQLTSSTILNSWESGKTDWKDQRIIASEYIISDLKRRVVIDERSMVIERSIYIDPCVHYTAYLAYSGLGPRNYDEEIKLSASRYKDSMNKNKFESDVNINANKDRQEMNITTHRATR